MSMYLGIDLHKRESTWVLLGEDRQELFKRSVAVTPTDITRSLLSLPQDPQPIHVVIEPVCGWRWVAAQLEQAGMAVHIANPPKTRAIAESRQKNDLSDARMLAELLRAGFLPESYRCTSDIYELRGLMRLRHYLVGLRSSVKNRLQAIVTREGLHDLTSIVRRARGRQVIRDGKHFECKELVALHDFLANRTRSIECMLEKTAPTLAVPKLLMTMPAVGPVTAMSVYAEVADFSRFQSPDKLTAYAGLVPSQHSSGKYERFGHITKTGSRLLRAVIVEAAFRIRDTEESRALFAFYTRVKKEAGAKRARAALGRKMLAIMWHMVKTQTRYQTPLSSDDTRRWVTS